MKFNVFAFSAPDFAPRRTIVRLAARNRVLQTILSIPCSSRLKSADRKASYNAEIAQTEVVKMIVCVGVVQSALWVSARNPCDSLKRRNSVFAFSVCAF